MNNFDKYYNYLNNYDMSNMNDFNKINQTSQSANSNLAEAYVAFMRGNLFDKLYDPYMNYKPIEINPTNEKDYALLMIQVYDFCAHELSLYLDNYPNDTSAIKLRSEYITSYKEALKQYEKKYGPLTYISKALDATPWAWDTNVWPWEGNY